MKKFELNKLDAAIQLIQRLADGKNPLTGEKIEDSEIIDNPDFIRGMYFIKEVLEEVKNINESISEKSIMKRNFPVDSLKAFQYEEDYSIANFVDKLNEYIDTDFYIKITYRPITNWLIANGYLKEMRDEENQKNIKVPTEKGLSNGIYILERDGKYGKYHINMYNQNMQELIIKNMDEIIAKTDVIGRVGIAWSYEEDQQLIEEIHRNIKISEISKIHGRTRGAIRARLKKLNLI